VASAGPRCPGPQPPPRPLYLPLPLPPTPPPPLHLPRHRYPCPRPPCPATPLLSLLVDHPVSHPRSHPTASKTTLPPAAILLSPSPWTRQIVIRVPEIPCREQPWSGLKGGFLALSTYPGIMINGAFSSFSPSRDSALAGTNRDAAASPHNAAASRARIPRLAAARTADHVFVNVREKPRLAMAELCGANCYVNFKPRVHARVRMLAEWKVR